MIEKCGFNIVSGCPMKCVGCLMSVQRKPLKYITPDTFEACLKNIDTKVKLLRLYNFGEPLLHSRLPALLKLIPNNVQNVEISTSGQFYDKDILKSAIKTKVITHFYVSCDGNGTPGDYEKLRPPAKWDRLVLFLKEVKNLRDKYAPKMHLGTRTICLKGRKRWEKILGPLGWKPIFRGWKVLPGLGDVKVPGGQCKFIRKGNRLYIDYDGTVVPCCRHPKAYVVGNLLNQTYTEIMGSKIYKAKAQQMKTDRKNMPVCGECEAK